VNQGFKKNSDALKYYNVFKSLNSNNLIEAKNNINFLINIQPNNPYFLEVIGEIEFRLGNIEEAFMHYNKAYKLSKENANMGISFANVAIIYASQADNKRRIEILEKTKDMLTTIAFNYPKFKISAIQKLSVCEDRLGNELDAKVYKTEFFCLTQKIELCNKYIKSLKNDIKNGENVNNLKFIQSKIKYLQNYNE
jgi:predicted Zn-dependent protease